jgi:hypothetical protein
MGEISTQLNSVRTAGLGGDRGAEAVCGDLE